MATASIELVGEASRSGGNTIPRWAVFLLISGLYLTLRGYHSFDGDQAYRLPLLLHQQDPSVYATDPFVRAFDTFNPHRGYLMLVGLASRPMGLAVGLAGLFALTFGATAIGVDRLARAVWPSSGVRVGLVALGLVLLAKAGNVGTNHLFESTLLDRLVGFALGWLAMASAVGDPRRGAWSAAPWLGLATLIHPSVGLQLTMTLGVSWVAWGLWSSRSGVSGRLAAGAVGGLGLALVPGLAMIGGQGGRFFQGLPVEEFRLLAVMVQGPQHMLPSTWRTSQWLAWGCYPLLGLLAMVEGASKSWPAARVRLALLMGVNLASLALAYLAVEVVGDLRVTVFQPFRMATLARGLALVALSGRLVGLWDRGDFASRARSVLVGVGLSGDWMLVVATAVELGMSFRAFLPFPSGRGTGGEGRRLARTVQSSHPLERTRRWFHAPHPGPLPEGEGGRGASETGRIRVALIGLTLLVPGLVFLVRHDTESGHIPLLAAMGVLMLGTIIASRRPIGWTPRRIGWALGFAWAIPVSAAIVPMVLTDPSAYRWSSALVARCRFAETPTDDLERLAVWCRDQTPASSRFIGPPGPKTFRLWSRRSLAFNRGGSPYHGEGLLDWSNRYRDHVGFHGSTAEFARAYLDGSHKLEARYQSMTPEERAALADRQGATHVLAAAPLKKDTPDPGGPLELLRVEGRYAVYRIRPIEGETSRIKDLENPAGTSISDSRKKFDGLPFQSGLND